MNAMGYQAALQSVDAVALLSTSAVAVPGPELRKADGYAMRSSFACDAFQGAVYVGANLRHGKLQSAMQVSPFRQLMLFRWREEISMLWHYLCVIC